MKRLSAITVALLTITTTPVQANELNYALDYEDKLAGIISIVSEHKLRGFESEKRLQSRLYANRDEVLDKVGTIKAKMCRLGDEGLPKALGVIEAFYGKRPVTLSNRLDLAADKSMVHILARIPCD
jgi:hypothetical protein